ncbi:UNVERIFIED_CONTAM: hypothetical protein H355_012862 [Colinus virginianus]|nr:hypothetical protein H355_012862 [Colinus virginianus]
MAPGGGSDYESKALQQRRQPYGITTSQADLPTLSTDATSNLENNRDGQSSEAEAAGVEAPITMGSAGCTSATQPQDHMKVHQKRPTQSQDSSDSVRQHVLQDEQRQGEQNQKHSQPQRRQEQQSQPWRLQCDLLRTVLVPPFIHERPSRTGSLQQKECADVLQKHDIDLHTRTQAASVVCRETLSHRERSISTTVERHRKISFAEPSAPSFLSRPGTPTSEEEKITDSALQTSPGDAYPSSHSIAQNPAADAFQCGDSLWTSDRVFVNANVTPEPSGSVHISLDRAEVSISPVTEDSLAAEVADIEPSKQCSHEQQAALVHPKANADNDNVTGDPTVHNAEGDTPCATNVPHTTTMHLGDFELADPRFGGEASLLGRGTYGIVRLMRHKPTGRLYAVKSIEKSSVVEAGMVSQVEFELLTQKDVLRHRNVLRCHAFLEDVDRVHMILEYCSGGDLYTRIRTQPLRRISEQEAFLYFAQLVNGLHYMHTRCIMHRDLKLENLLLDKDGVLKIADLGWCTTILGKRRNFNFCGTLDYLAPEMIRGDGHDWRVDLWGAVYLQQQGDHLPVASPGTSCSQSADTYVEQLTSRSIVNKGPQPYSLNIEETYKLDRETEFDAASTYGEQSVTAVPSHEQCAQGEVSAKELVAPCSVRRAERNSGRQTTKRTGVTLLWSF